MKITVVAGARPNFMKIAPIIHAIKLEQKKGTPLTYRLVHTGQHYDKAMSDTFFEELGIPYPDANLEVGSGSQASQTGMIMIRFEEELMKNPADVVLVVGDINSTMACSIVAKKLCIQLVHVEAGIRSFDLEMPEEINRMVTDAITDHFFTTSHYANSNLAKLGIEKNRIHFVGNTMIDTLMANMSKFRRPTVSDEKDLKKGNYLVLTLHRPSNVDQLENLEKLLVEISRHSRKLPIIFPAHPRTAVNLQKLRTLPDNLQVIPPLGYLEFMYLVKNSFGVITDSGGIQEETTVMKVPCMTLRKNSERPETVFVGTNELVHSLEDIQHWMEKLFDGKWKTGDIPELWDGNTSQRIVTRLCEIYIN
jgi:UDP-N-acetylglucosamine 2-epimerase (non-hydrolysing)